jgi:putative CocE/NonD family hydrolase
LQNVAPAVMTVGGWFDAEDLYGPLKIYHEVEQRNPQVFNILVMGPWRHGGWARGDGDRLGDARFDAKTSLYYQGHVERAFFDYYLKDGPPPELPEALVFETGENRWRRFPNWPPSGLQVRDLHLHAGGVLDFEPAAEPPGAADEFISDPAKPVPFTADISTRMVPDYMTADQRFAARRPDVLSYQTAPLDEDLTLAGPLQAELWVETTGTAADWVVKLIDVFPPDAEDPEGLPPGVRMGGYQMMIRSEVLRGCYRNGYERPEAFVPGQPTVVRLELLDVLHTFKKGHRVMIQVQSSWFPLVDRNPQTHVANIFLAEEADFVKATHRVHRSPQYPSRVRVGVLEVEQPAD